MRRSISASSDSCAPKGAGTAAEQRIAELHEAIRARGQAVPAYQGELPEGHDGSGLALLGITRR